LNRKLRLVKRERRTMEKSFDDDKTNKQVERTNYYLYEYA